MTQRLKRIAKEAEGGNRWWIHSFILAEWHKDEGSHLVDSSMYISKSFAGMYNGVALETCSVVESVPYSGVLPVSGTPDPVFCLRIRP
jgi:hypothetical protein